MIPGGVRAAWRRSVMGLARPPVVRRVASACLAMSGRGGSRPWPGFDRLGRIAVVRHDGMGDLRRAAPRARITLVTRPEWVGLMEACPHLDEVIGFEVVHSPRWMVHRNVLRAWSFARRELWPRRFDAVVVPQCRFSYFESRYLAAFSGAPVRVGRRDAADSAEPAGSAGWRMYSEVVETPPDEHEAESCARFLRALGAAVADPALELHWGEAAAREAEAAVPPGFRGSWLVAVAAGASQPWKRWPSGRFAAVMRRIAARGLRMVLVGGDDCVAESAALRGEFGDSVLDLSGRLSLPASAALLSRCALFVGNDTGPMHVAAAVGIPVVEIVGWPADVPWEVNGTPRRIGPYCARRRIVQPVAPGLPARPQVDLVGEEAVWAAVEELLAEPAGQGGEVGRG